MARKEGPMPDNRQTIERFYSAFAQLDANAMEDCYAPDVQFEDEVFTLQGRHEVAGMWRMLCDAVRDKGQADWKPTWRDARAEGSQGSAHWDAHYRFTATGRLVDNSIDAAFTFAPDGRIVQHRDRFSFWRWSRQALGAPGLVLGWTPMLRGAVRKKAQANLRKYLQRGAA
jgi:ketosteroid isomerase-like protein